MATNRILAGSEREAIAGARSVGKADPSERLQVSVIVRRRTDAQFQAHLAKALAGHPDAAAALTREQFAQQFGAHPDDLAAVRKFAAAHGLTVELEHGARRTAVLSGTVAQFNAAFGIDLQRFQHPNGSYRGWAGPLHLPAELHEVVETVLGLDNRQVAKPHFRVLPAAQGAPAAHASVGSFTPLQLGTLYGFPAGNGAGQCIGIIELGGGFKPADLSTYFSSLHVSPQPQVVAVAVDGASNAPTGEANGPDGEVMLDIEVAGALAPAARLAVYFGPNTDAGFLDAITSAIHDTTNKPTVLSISWGGPESTWTAASLKAYDTAFQEAAALGINVCVASGDSGSSDGLTGDHVDFPASSPHVLACGGTRLAASGGKITAESVWNEQSAGGGAGGGGISKTFAVPAWQQGLKATKASGSSSALKKRGVPDVAGDADPQTGYQVRVDGQNLVYGGTSAVAPLWAALIARLNAKKGSTVGFLNPKLYALKSGLNDITTGNNGDFAAAKGWDACTGLGTPNATLASQLT